MAGRGCMIFLLAVFNVVFSSSNYVPVVLWQSQSLGNDLPSVSAVNQISTNEFEDDILNKLDNKAPVLFFLQDDLSLEDFTLFGNVYGKRDQKNSFTNIHNLLDTNPSTMLPSVESPEDGISSLAEGRKVVEIKGEEFDPKGQLENSLLVFHLPSTDDVTNRQNALSQNDKIIGDVIKKVAANSPSYTAIYTGHSSSWFAAEDEHIRTSRRALAVGDTATTTNHTGTFYNDTSCLVYFEGMTFDYYNNNGTADKPFTPVSIVLSNDSALYTFTCTVQGNTTMGITVDYANAGASVSQVSVIMQFSQETYNDWQLSNMSITYTVDPSFGISGNNPLDVDDNFWAPLGFSYHCAPQSFIHDQYNYMTPTENKAKGGVTFTNFQIQPFPKDSSAFGDAFDCVGFFSIGIWMGIFVVGILIVILGFGINMTLSVNTMDRFDDPKGKTITVNASD